MSEHTKEKEQTDIKRAETDFSSGVAGVCRRNSELTELRKQKTDISSQISEMNRMEISAENNK